MGNCQAGNGSTGIDITYNGHLEVKVKNGTALEIFSSKDFTSPTTDDKDPFDITDVRVPTDVGFEIEVIIDGKECSLCEKSLCQPSNQDEVENGTIVTYQINNGFSYWTASRILNQVDVASNTISFIQQ